MGYSPTAGNRQQATGNRHADLSGLLLVAGCLLLISPSGYRNQKYVARAALDQQGAPGPTVSSTHTSFSIDTSRVTRDAHAMLILGLGVRF
jgi:hypothetical protein